MKSGKTLREFLLSYSNKNRSTMRSVYFALKFFYELAKKDFKITSCFEQGRSKQNDRSNNKHKAQTCSDVSLLCRFAFK